MGSDFQSAARTDGYPLWMVLGSDGRGGGRGYSAGDGPGSMNLIIYAVASFGFAYIVGHSKISLPVRIAIEPNPETRGAVRSLRVFLLTLLECPACLGFWTGLIAGMTNVWLTTDGAPLGSPLACALFTSGSNLLLAKLGGLFDE